MAGPRPQIAACFSYPPPHDLPFARNAPWVSAVVEIGGTVRPCFFHPPIGNVSNSSLRAVLHSPDAIRFRKTLDVATNATCRRCVCSLYLATPLEAPAFHGAAQTQ